MERAADRLRRSDRLLDSRDYRRVSRQGSRAASNSFVLLVAPMGPMASNSRLLAGRRLGLTVSRRVGNAVVRNRVKRRIREWFRHLRDDPATDVDLVVIARRAAAGLASEQAAGELASLFRQAVDARLHKRAHQGLKRG